MAVDPFYKQRVSENLKREILWAITNELRDPDVPSMITVSAIELAQDTRNATVFISFFGEEAEKELAIGKLNKAAKMIQMVASKRVKIKNFPRLYFKIDNSFEERDHITELLKKVEDDLNR